MLKRIFNHNLSNQTALNILRESQKENMEEYLRNHKIPKMGITLEALFKFVKNVNDEFDKGQNEMRIFDNQDVKPYRDFCWDRLEKLVHNTNFLNLNIECDQEDDLFFITNMLVKIDDFAYIFQCLFPCYLKIGFMKYYDRTLISVGSLTTVYYLAFLDKNINIVNESLTRFENEIKINERLE